MAQRPDDVVSEGVALDMVFSQKKVQPGQWTKKSSGERHWHGAHLGSCLGLVRLEIQGTSWIQGKVWMQ